MSHMRPMRAYAVRIAQWYTVHSPPQRPRVRATLDSTAHARNGDRHGSSKYCRKCSHAEGYLVPRKQCFGARETGMERDGRRDAREDREAEAPAHHKSGIEDA